MTAPEPDARPAARRPIPPGRRGADHSFATTLLRPLSFAS